MKKRLLLAENVFETKVEALLNAVGIAYERLDDGGTPGAPDFCLGLNHGVQVVTELKTADGEGTVGLNEATDVIRGAAIVNLVHLPKATLANPGFDPNAHWQARNVERSRSCRSLPICLRDFTPGVQRSRNGRFSQLASATRLTFYPPTFRKWQLIATIALARETPICSKRPSVMYTT